MPTVYRPDTNIYSDEEIMENRKEWAEALKSGKYEQGHYYLNKNDKFCCLGVACEVLGLEGVLEHEVTAVAYAGKAGYPPASVLRALGLPSTNQGGELESGEELTILNDNDGYTFEQIAERILSETKIVREY